MNTKKCLVCKKDYHVQHNVPFEISKFCSRICMGINRRVERIKLICPVCGKSFTCFRNEMWKKTPRKFCGFGCRNRARRIPIHFNSINRGGYNSVMINGKYIKEHRYIMQKHLGRELDRQEYVHHKNRNKRDNRIENLEIMTNSEHMKLHKPETGRDFTSESVRKWHKETKKCGKPIGGFYKRPHGSKCNRPSPCGIH